jgi:hypothetical protein
MLLARIGVDTYLLPAIESSIGTSRHRYRYKTFLLFLREKGRESDRPSRP